ncbi:MAG: hypothetical protein E7370_05550 [Clostridiales bacterium]|nr:hypothetical protein [Clostridiales bacterium]
MKDFTNYNEYDRIFVAINSAVAEETLNGYKALGWQLIRRFPDKIYSNIEHFDFYRSHKIENKDRLQLLQVYMESEINNLSYRRHNRHSASITVGILVYLFCLMLIVGGTLMACIGNNLFTNAGGYIILALGVLGSISFVFYLKYLSQKETERYNRQIEFSVNRIRRIYEEASNLTGVRNG